MRLGYEARGILPLLIPEAVIHLAVSMDVRALQNQLKGQQMLHCICLAGWNAGFHTWVMVGYGFEFGEYCRR